MYITTSWSPLRKSEWLSRFDNNDEPRYFPFVYELSPDDDSDMFIPQEPDRIFASDTPSFMDVPICELCDSDPDELVLARLILVSGETVHKCLCDDCILKLKQYTKKER